MTFRRISRQAHRHVGRIPRLNVHKTYITIRHSCPAMNILRRWGPESWRRRMASRTFCSVNGRSSPGGRYFPGAAVRRDSSHSFDASVCASEARVSSATPGVDPSAMEPRLSELFRRLRVVGLTSSGARADMLPGISSQPTTGRIDGRE